MSAPANKMKVPLTFKLLSRVSSGTYNAYGKCLKAIINKAELSEAEIEFFTQVVDKYDQASFDHITTLVDDLSGVFIRIKGTYKFELFQHKKSITVWRLQYP